jgi:hypothetical protein
MNLWIQYTHDDPDNAAVLQTADSEAEARREDRTISDSGVWYCYRIVGKELEPVSGPHRFYH